jgi:hypothetical protein
MTVIGFSSDVIGSARAANQLLSDLEIRRRACSKRLMANAVETTCVDAAFRGNLECRAYGEGPR